MINSVDFKAFLTGSVSKKDAFEKTKPDSGPKGKIILTPTPEKATFEPNFKITEEDEAKTEQPRMAPRNPNKPQPAVQYYYVPKDEDDLERKIQARKDFEEYKAKKMAEWDEAHPMKNPYDKGNGVRTMQYDFKYEDHLKARAQYEYEIECEFWESNPDYIPSHVMIQGEPVDITKYQL